MTLNLPGVFRRFSGPALALLALAAPAAAQLAAHTVTSADGLTIGFDDQGRLVYFGESANEVPPGALGGIYIRDLRGNGPVPSVDPLGFVNSGDGTPTGWTREALSQATLTYEPRPGGGNYLRIDSTSASAVVLLSRQPVAVVGGEFYRLELGAKTGHGYWGTGTQWDGKCEATASVRWLDAGGQLLAEDQAARVAYSSRDWKRLGGVVKAPSSAVQGVIELSFVGAVPGTSSATLWLDDVAFGVDPTLRVWPVGTASTPQPNRVQAHLADAASGFAVDFTVSAGAVGIRIDGEVTNTDAGEPSRVLDLGFGVPLAADGWTWWDDVQESRPIGTRFFTNVVNVDETGLLSLSAYPLSAVADATRGYSLAWPMAVPRIARIEYDLNDDLFSILFALGLSNLTTRFPNKASFSLYVYSIPEPEWGFRSALQRYYEIEEEAFAEKIVDGAPLRSGGEVIQVESIFDSPGDFALRMVVGRYAESGSNSTIDYAVANGAWPVHYTRPWDVTDNAAPLDQPVPNYETVLADLQVTAGGTNLEALLTRGALNSLVGESNGNVQFQRFDELIAGSAGLWSARLPLNLDPELSGDPNAATVVPDEDLGPGLANIEARQPAAQPGWFLDGFFTSSGLLDHRSDRWGTSDLPLTYSPNTLTPAAHVALGNIEFLQWMEGVKQSLPDVITVGNFNVPGLSGLGSAYVDAIVYETDALSLTAEQLADNRRYRRFLGRHRPVIELYNRGPSSTVWSSYSQFESNYLRPQWNGLLLYGIFPGCLNEMRELSLDLEAGRVFYRQFVPIVHALQEAGWEPVTHAVPSDPALLVERHGSGEGAYLAVYNPTTTTKGYTLAVDPGGVGMGRIDVAQEVISGAFVAGSGDATVFTISDSVAAGKVRVLRLSGSQSCLGEINGDGIVDGLDLIELALQFGRDSGDPLWDARVDLDSNGVIDGIDLSLLAANFGKSTCN